MTRHLRACLCAALLSTVACGESEEVLVQNPGRMEGVVVLEGHEPPCEGGAPSGQLVFELYPWSEQHVLGSFARGLEQVHVVPAAEVLGASDCDGGPDRTRSSAFALEEVGPPPGAEAGRTYLVRVIYDVDGDYRSEPEVLRTPTRGDLIGGVVEGLPEEGEVFQWLPVRFEPPADHPEGQVIDGLTVTLGLAVNLEPPASRLTIERPLSSEATIPITNDSIARENFLWELTGMKIELLGDDALDALDAEGLSLGRDAEAMAWVVDEIDDDGDGAGDLHPILGDAGVPWLAPTVVFERVRSEAEHAAGIPRVRFVASIRPTVVAAGLKEVFYPRMDLIVPPTADMVLTPAPECAIPVVPAGNEIGTYERVPVDCQELPTGVYDARVLHGRAGSSAMEVDSLFSDIGVDWDESLGDFAAQSWILPNALAVPGQDRTLSVVDEDPSSAPDPTLAVPGHGVEACSEALDASMEPPEMRAIDYIPVPDHCCAPVRHLCGLPLCDAQPAPEGEGVVRTLGELGEEGEIPCVPFAMPASCCR